MASQEAEAINSMWREVRKPFLDAPATVEEQRSAIEGIAQLASEPSGVSYTLADVDGIPGLWADPVRCAHDRVILVLHGGGYIAGSIEGHRRLAGHLARSVGCRVLIVDYRLAPEHPFPAGLDDAVTAFRWLVARGTDASRIALYGDSAGGGLAVATLLRLRAESLPLPAGSVLFSPLLDLVGTGESMKTRAEVDLLGIAPSGLGITRRHYLDGHDPKDPLVSPVYADLTGLSPLYVQVGDNEVLLDDSTRLASNARRDGVEVRLDVFPEMQHVFQFSAGNVPEADDAIRRVGEWLRPRLGLAESSPA